MLKQMLMNAPRTRMKGSDYLKKNPRSTMKSRSSTEIEYMADTKLIDQTEFYISKGGENLGPWAIEEMAAQMSRNELAPTDFVFIDDSKSGFL